MNRHSWLLTGTVVVLLPLSDLAAASEPGSGRPEFNFFYVGAGIADAEPSLFEGSSSCYYGCGYSTNGSTGVGFTLTGGWRFHRYMALEAGYVYGGNPGYTDHFAYIPGLLGTYDVYAEMDYESLDLSLVGIFEGRMWDAYVKGGPAYYDARSRQNIVQYPSGATVQREVQRDSMSFVFAIGGGLRFGGDRYRLRLEYRIIPISRQLLASPSGDASMGIADLQLQVRFGQ